LQACLGVHDKTAAWSLQLRQFTNGSPNGFVVLWEIYYDILHEYKNTQIYE